MSDQMESSFENKWMPMTSVASGLEFDVLPGVYCYTNQIVNVVFLRSGDDWYLIDAGMPHSADTIKSAFEVHAGVEMAPKAILLTHGHFDHVGGIIELVEQWQVPVYAHALELPYLTGQKDYPEPDGSVEGGLIAKMSRLFPNDAINLTDHVQALGENGQIPGLPEWKWIHTPGHTPGHVSFYREEDRTLIAGDAFVTVRQDSLYKVFTQKQELSGPPRYYTTDWHAAWNSVKTLEALKPSTAITGHGLPMSGEELRHGLAELSRDFEKLAMPDHGKYLQ
ncbi:MBL fold metallo-hydrolase [Metabacillus idriensis]|uniref:MBL fold metallo-hydrolase n=1 Tax=Metabacillus idriensis TaxID=324768 RepID=A0A6I2MG61_9BACI|nr:MBL fold metallo-hydrolase [Metabacillus idriensis]MCM3597858.1 MBL fold metallo-hydrolase [Metabacillus idriensis]MRX56344.1 MBL fold metallo-hydrolase [Metabacillus idriensis]OHR70604.1 MBL fold metallo-hydrolase [Bacillus sp. HMSC76G11]